MRPAARSDRGFTLIEVVVVIALLALVMSVLTAAVAVIIRSQRTVGSQASEARTLRNLETWLGQDVAGVPPTGFDFSPGTTTGCSGSSPGANLVRLRWTEQIGSTTTYIAAYRFEDAPTGGKQIVRYTCSGTGAGPYTNRASNRVGVELATTTPTITPITSGANTIGVSVQATTTSGALVRASASSRNPSSTLPATTTSTTTVPPACTVTAINLPMTRPNNGSGIRRLQATATISITVSGACGVLALRYDRGDGDGIQTDTFVGTTPNFSVTLPATNSERWSEGPKTMTVLNGSVTLTTGIFTVT